MIFLHKLITKKVIRTFKRITFFYVAILLGIASTSAQSYYFDNYSVKDGLPLSKAYDILQDNEGYIWIATENGVSKFDGISFRNYTADNGLAEDGVKTLLKDEKGNIWMGHKSGGLTFYNGSNFIIHPISDSIGVEITSLLMNHQNVLWITTMGEGLVRLDNPNEVVPSKMEYEQFKGGRLSDLVFSSIITKDDDVFFITDAGIKEYNSKENSFEGFTPEGLVRYFAFTSMLEDKKGDLWIGTYHGGLYHYNKEKKEFKIYDARDGLADNWVTCITEDSNGNIWVGTWGGGISKITDQKIKTFNNKNGLIDQKIYRIIEDLEGNMLIATYEHGILIFKGEKFVSYGTNDGLMNAQVSAITQDKGGKYWFGTNKGISVLNLSSGEKGIRSAHYDMASNVGDHIVFLKNDASGNIWIGTTDNGVSMYNYKTGRFVYDPYINSYLTTNQVVTALEVDNKNQLWVGTQFGLIYHDIANSKSQFLTQISGLNGTSISALFADSKGRVWVGIDSKGINLIENDSIGKIEYEGLVTPKCFSEDQEGNIWIGTLTKGILICDGRKIIKTLNQNDGLLSNLVTQISVDNNNNKFIGTSLGLNKIDTEGKIHIYTEKSGFAGIEAKENASYKDKNGNLWFGTVAGVVKYQPQYDYSRAQEPFSHIARLRVNLKDRELIPGLKLNYKDNSVIIDYNSISLNNPDAVQYQIMLEPADKDWSPVTKQTSENYSSLAPGKYTFKLKAKNSAGVWNSEPITYSFIIRPPIWKRWWFILSMVVLGVVIIISYIKVREKNLIREKNILEEKVEERTAEVVQKSIELEKKNKDITDSIRYAKRIQTAVLPPEVPFENTFIFFRPKDIVSGDFYWLEMVGEKEMIAAVDCTGHGVPGAFLSILGHGILTKIVREYGMLKPSEILDQLDIEIINALHQKNVKGERVVNDGMDLALICYNKDTQILEYSGAFNSLIQIRNGELEEIKADRFPIGMTSVHGSKSFTNHEIKVEKGDAYYIFSDGYADQFGGDDGRKFRKKNMKDLLVSIQDKSMKEQGAELERFIIEWMGEYEQIDDIVFVGRGF